MIRIAVDAWNAADPRGTGRYLRAILAEWDAHFRERVRLTLVIPENFSLLYATRYRRAVRLANVDVRSRARPGRFDAWWFPFNGPSWDAWSGKSVATLHDASPFVLPSDDGIRATFTRGAARCDRIVTDSIFAAEDLARTLAIASERLHAIPLGVAPLAVAPSTIDPRAFGRYVLYVGATEPRKNMATVFAAMRVVQARLPDVRLVIVGPETFGLPSAEGVRVDSLGVLDDASVAAFFRAASAFVYASTYEGFGLPILEAMSYGTPVVAAKSSSLPEAGGSAARYAEPLDAAGFANALIGVLTDDALAAEMRAAGYARATELTWKRTADATLRVFEELTEG